jgi:hypothetical protein
MVVVLSSRGNLDTFLSNRSPRRCYHLTDDGEGSVLCTVKNGDFVVQVFSVSVSETMHNNGTQGKTILLSGGGGGGGGGGDGGKMMGSLYFSSFDVSESSAANNMFSTKLLVDKARPNMKSGACYSYGSRLWLHLMDGLGFSGKNKCNITVRFELVEKLCALDEKTRDAGSLLGDGVVLHAVTSTCSVHARHLVWDQKMEMLIAAEVMQSISKSVPTVAKKRAVRDANTSSAAEKVYLLRASMWQDDDGDLCPAKSHLVSSSSSSSSSTTGLVAAAERNIADILAPFLHVHMHKESGTDFAAPPPPIRHEIVFPLRLLALAADHPAAPPSSHRTRTGSDVRLRVGILLFSNEETVHCQQKETLISPTGARHKLVEDAGDGLDLARPFPPAHVQPGRRGTLESNVEHFMSKGGWFTVQCIMLCAESATTILYLIKITHFVLLLP